MCVPAAFTQETGEAHWHTLLKARAIENQCYVIAAAQTGTHVSGRQTYGHSIIIDPWGRVLLELNQEEGCGSASIDLLSLRELRRQFPVLSHRKLP